MKIVNDVLRPLFDLLQAPLSGLPALVGVLIWSIPIGVFALWVFGKTSNQDRIAAVKKRIHAGLFEIRLFNDDLAAILSAQWEILCWVARYQVLALKPMIFILPPLVLVMVQLHQFYGFRPLHEGDSVMLTVELTQGRFDPDRRPEISLTTPQGLHVETGPVWAQTLGEISWQLAVDELGDHQVAIDVDGHHATKSVRATHEILRLSPTRPPRTFLGQLEWPSEPPLDPDGAIHSITVAYPEGMIDVFGWEFEWSFAWMAVFFLLTMVVALALRKPMGVEL